MFDRLIDVALQFIELFKFWVVVDAYERGVVLRWGKFQRELEPGLHWLIPLGIDRPLLDNVVTRTDELRNSTLTLRDGASVSVSVVVRYNIRDVKKALLEVEGISDVIRDSVIGNVSDHVRAATWETLPSPEFGESLSKSCRKMAWRYGIEIESVVFADLARVKPLALLQG